MKWRILHLLFLAAAPPAFAAEFHISPKGDDGTGDGTVAHPFASLEKARDTARLASGGATVFLHDGVYRLDKTFQLDARDSGTEGRKMLYAAAPGAHPVLSGARPVEGWKPGKNGIFTAAAGDTPFRQFFVDGAWAPRACGPYMRAARVNPGEGSFTLNAKDWPTAFADGAPSDLEMVVHDHWRHLTVHCATSRIEKGAVVMTIPEEEKKTSFTPKLFGGGACRFENALALLDEPGEWYREPAGTLHYLPKPGTAPAQIKAQVPVLETLVEVSGTPEAPVHDLEFRGITIAGTGWSKPSQSGLYATQFAQPYSGPASVPGAFMTKNTLRFAFRNGAVVCAGGNGFVMENTVAMDIGGNTFRDIGCNGIEGRAMVKDAAIWNNEIAFCGRDISNGGGLLLRNPTSGALIEHNHIHDMPYSGMQVGDQPGGDRDTGTKENKIRFNHVHDCMGLHDDGGGIYTLGGQQTGSEIAFNFVHDIRRSHLAGDWPVDGVYLDNFTQFIHVHHNVIRDCTTAAKEQNHSVNNRIEDTVPHDPKIEKNAGVMPGFEPRSNH